MGCDGHRLFLYPCFLCCLLFLLGCDSARSGTTTTTTTTISTTTKQPQPQTAPAGKGGTLEPRFFSHVEGVSDDPSPTGTKPTPRAVYGASGQHHGKSARKTPATQAAERNAAAAAAAATTTTTRQPRARSGWMLHDGAPSPGVKRSSGGGGGRGGGRGGGKPAAEP